MINYVHYNVISELYVAFAFVKLGSVKSLSQYYAARLPLSRLYFPWHFVTTDTRKIQQLNAFCFRYDPKPFG